MPRIDVVSIKKENYVYFENCLNYIAKEDHCIEGYIGATHIYLPMDRNMHVPFIRTQVSTMRSFYQKQNNRLGLHITINFSPEEQGFLNKGMMLQIAYHLAETEFPSCMTYFAVHDNVDLNHIHMLIIPINVYTGYMYGCGKAGWNTIEDKLRKLLKTIMPESVVGGFQVAYRN